MEPVHICIVISKPNTIYRLCPPIIVGEDINHLQIGRIYHGIISHVTYVNVRFLIYAKQIKSKNCFINYTLVPESFDEIGASGIVAISCEACNATSVVWETFLPVNHENVKILSACVVSCIQTDSVSSSIACSTHTTVVHGVHGAAFDSVP